MSGAFSVELKVPGGTATITTEMLAKAFWMLGADGQAEFLDQLADVIEEDHKTNPNSYGLGEYQWCWLKSELRRPGMERANKMHMALSAFAFEFWPQKNNGAREGI